MKRPLLFTASCQSLGGISDVWGEAVRGSRGVTSCSSTIIVQVDRPTLCSVTRFHSALFGRQRRHAISGLTNSVVHTRTSALPPATLFWLRSRRRHWSRLRPDQWLRSNLGQGAPGRIELVRDIFKGKIHVDILALGRVPLNGPHFSQLSGD